MNEDGMDMIFLRQRAWKPSKRRLSACNNHIDSRLYRSFGNTIALYNSSFLFLGMFACDQHLCIALKMPFASPIRL
eukprot:2940039-Pyramimonas_sp.AAC.1